MIPDLGSVEENGCAAFFISRNPVIPKRYAGIFTVLAGDRSEFSTIWGW
jgi:hypothetical protein